MNKIIFIIVFLLSAQSAYAASLTRAPNNLGLVGYWPFNEGTGLKAGDFSGRGGHGTLTNGPTWTGGRLGGALQFDGMDDYVATGKVLSSFISASTGTMSVWVKPTGASPTGGAPYQVQGIISDVLAYQGIYRGVIGGVDRIWIYNWDGSSDSVGVPYTTNEWIHVVWVHSGGSLYAYANGVFVGSTASGNTSDLTQIVNIGLGYQAFPDFAGSLDEVRIYNRALGANEITRLYQAGSARVTPPGSTDGLVGYWSLNDCQRTRATDQSGRGNHGTLNGFSFTGTSSNWVTGDNAKDLCAVALDGTDNYIDMGDPANGSLDFGTGAFTVSAWFKAPSTAKATYRTIAAKYFAPGYWIQTDANGYIVAGVSGAIELQGTRDYFDNQWHHVIYTRRGTGTNEAFLYVDGVLEVTGTSSGSASSANALYVGSFPGLGRYWIGSIDEVRVYSRGFTAQEARALYAGSTRKAQASSGSLTAGTSLATGLVGHWTFDGAHMTGTGGVGTAKDVSGNNNHGALTNNPMRTLGKMGQALSFDGVNDYVDAGNGASLTVTDLTVSFWFKPTTTFDSSTGRKDLLAKYLSYWVILNYPANNGTIALAVNGGNSVNSTQTSWTAGRWYHFVGTISGTTGTMYIDGTQSATGGLGSPPSAQSYTLQFGGNTTAGTYGGFTMDDVRIYNRALSASEVKQLYNLAR